MRVAYVCADLGVPVYGTKGCSIHVQEVVRSFQRLGHEVVLFATRLGGNCPESLVNVALHHLPIQDSQSAQNREAKGQLVAKQIQEQMEQQGPFDMVYERYSLWSTAGCDYAHTHGIPCLLEVNAPLIDEQDSHRKLHDRGAALRIAGHAFRSASSVVAVSDAVQEHVLQLAPSQTNAHVIVNGVDVNRFTPAAEDQRPPTANYRVGFVGTLKPWHGVDLLLEAFQRLIADIPNAQLVIVGDGPLREELTKRYCGPENVLARNVHWTGSIASEKIPEQLRQFDVGVAPYPCLENFYFSPLKIFEYMSCGLPVVASHTGQIAALVDDERTGLLVQPGSIAELTNALKRLHDDPALRLRLGRTARQKALLEFSWDRVLNQALDTLSVCNCDS